MFPDGEEPEELLIAPSQTYSHEYGGMRRMKVFNDNVHGNFHLHRASVAVLDTPPFQRLRNLKQLGLAYQVYPSASHNRFEHSLGVAHLATKWGLHLLNSREGVGEDGWQLRRPEREDRQHLTVLQLAGLTHDLGHGPFSHVFEKELLPRLGLDEGVVREWHHEVMSNRILDHILEDPDNGIDLEALAGLDSGHVRLIKQLMHGSSNPASDYPAAPWLFDVVANKRTGIDVDKFDYLQRDSRACGVRVPLDAERLMMFSRLDPDMKQIIFKQTEYSNLAVGLFQSRSEMHRRVYTHQKIKSVEFMVCDALALAAGPLGLHEALLSRDVSRYLLLDDSLLQRVAALDAQQAEAPGDILKAQELLTQLWRRKLYKFVEEVTLDVKAQERYTRLPTPAEVVSFQSATHGVTLNPDDVILCEIHIDHGKKGGGNPMEGVRFFQTADPDQGPHAFAMPQQQVSSMLGTVYQDKIIRVYSKNPDKAVCKALKEAFGRWSRHKHNCVPPGTPWKQPQPQQQQPICVDLLNGRAAEAASLATQLQYRSGSADGSGSQSDPQQQQQQRHMGSGGRSRKRSLSQEMAGAAAAAAGGGGSGGGGGGSQEAGLLPEVLSLSAGLGSGGGSGGSGGQRSGRPPKAARHAAGGGANSLAAIAEEEGG